MKNLKKIMFAIWVRKISLRHDTKVKMSYVGLHEFKNIFWKGTINKMKKIPKVGEMFAKDIYIIKNFHQEYIAGAGERAGWVHAFIPRTHSLEGENQFPKIVL